MITFASDNAQTVADWFREQAYALDPCPLFEMSDQRSAISDQQEKIPAEAISEQREESPDVPVEATPQEGVPVAQEPPVPSAEEAHSSIPEIQVQPEGFEEISV